MNISKNLKNWYLLLYYTRIIRKYDKRVPMDVIKIRGNDIQFFKLRIGSKLLSIIITSQKRKFDGITHIKFIWANPTLYLREGESYQNIYDTFMHWQHLFLTSVPVNGLREFKVTLALDDSNMKQVEKLRRILTLYGFYPDKGITLSDLDFKKPWREKESVKYIIYSRLF